MVDTGLIEHTGRGVYRLAGLWEVEIYKLQVPVRPCYPPHLIPDELSVDKIKVAK